MSLRNLISASSIVFLLGGVYFATLAELGEASIYAIAPAVLCLVAFGLATAGDWLLTGPWRSATAILSITLLVVQEVANFSVVVSNDYFTLMSIILNGIYLVLFAGVLLSTLKVSVIFRQEEESVPRKQSV